MRGLDTNVLLRSFIVDDLIQAKAVRRGLEEAQAREERLFISTIVLCELIWTLRGKPYAFDRATLSNSLDTLLNNDLFEIQHRDLVRGALQDFREGKADFADYLVGWENREAGCRDTLTFDRDLAVSPGFSLLS